MKLARIKIRNFRSIRCLRLDPGPMTTLIGKNNSGKSNILRGLRFFFTFSARSATLDDICKFSDDEGTWVECTFSELTEADRSEVPEKYIRHDGSIRLRRTLQPDDDRAVTKLRGYVQRPTAEWLQDDYADYADMDKWVALGIDVSDYATFGKRGGITKDTFKEFRPAYITQHAEELDFVEELSDTEFKGRQSTAATVLPHLIFVPAVGDIVSVIYGKQTSLLNEMVAAVIELGKTDPLYTTAQEGLSAAQQLVNPSDSRLRTLTRIEEDLEQKLESWPGTRVTIRTEIADLARILVDGLVLSVDDGHDTHLSDKGDGIQRQILFRVFQLYADFRAQRGIFRPADGAAPRERGSSIIAFEEPELFLHPQAQEQFHDDLITVSQTDQVLLATHSNYLVRLEQADVLHIVRRESPTAPTTFTTADQNWLTADDRQRLKEIDLCSGDVSKVFFADRVVVTEGQADVIYIVGTARDHADCLNRQVTVVESGGKERIPSMQKVLNAFGIPYVVACDKDPDNQASADTSARIEALVNEANANEVDGPIASVEHFDPDIANECHGTEPPPGDKPYNALVFIRDGTPTKEFVDRVKQLYRLPGDD